MKKGQEPAFPTEYNFAEEHKDGSFQTGNTMAHMPGMSTRLYLAGMAMQGLMVQAIPDRTNQDTPENNRARINFALNMADELLKQEEETR